MKYKQIVQELRESQDLNVQIFLNDVDKITKLSQKEKKSLLTKLQNPDSHDHQDRLCEQSADEFCVVSRSGGRGCYRCL